LPSPNFLAKAEAEWLKTNLTELIEDNFKRFGTNFMHSKTPEEARAKIREELVRVRALSMATNSTKRIRRASV